ncbi:MAG TPA: amidohydrolase family protein [Dehalococcoidia bacterium]|nr:amidohydrolase family protein [Dehalococcoidia bacterium]
MPTIDADTHVIETERTWDFIEPEDQKYRPVIVTPRGEPDKEYWMVDGNLWGVAWFSGRDFKEMSRLSGRDMDVPREAREMDDISRRLQHMDELEVDVQVLYPSFFLSRGASRPAVDLAICRGYNRWLANVWKQSEGRLRWVCVPPLLSMTDAIDEVRWSREHGAVGIFMRCVEGERVLHDPYFDPIYEEAVRLDLPVAVHIANSNEAMGSLLAQHSRSSTFWNLRLALVGAFHAIVLNGLPERFPRLRMGFVEGASQWLPYVINDLRRRLPALGRRLPENFLSEYRLYVTCQTDDDIQYVMSYVGEDNLLIGTDYGHNDQSSELEALRHLNQSGQITPAQYKKLTSDNPAAFHGI